MKKRVLSLALFLSLAVSLFTPALAAGTDPVAPSAPEWINAEDYVIFPGDEVYQPDNWAEIEAMREAARNGGTEVFRADGSPIDNRWPVGYGSAGFCFEVGLVWLKCAENAGMETKEGRSCLTHASRAFQIGAEEYYEQGMVQYGETLYYRTKLMGCRAYVLSASYNNIHVWCGAMSTLLPALEMTMEEFFDAPHMERITAENRYILTEELNEYLDEHNLPVLPSAEGHVQIFLDGKYIRPDIPAIVTHGRTMIPIRSIAVALGADVGWEDATQQVTLERAGTTIVMTLGSKTALVNGAPITMDIAPYTEQDRTLLPVRYVAEFFGQKVDWEESTQRVYITEDKSVVGDSNLEAWALPMGSMLAWANNGASPTWFGMYARTADSAEDCRSDLASGWGISSREDLVSTVLSMTLFGHNASFQSTVADVKQRSEADRKAISESSSAWPYFMWEYTEQLAEKWGDKGILAWDLFRMSNLVQWGYTAGYVTYEEALALVEPAAILLQATFSSWDEAYENYVDGYTWWARTSAEEWANTGFNWSSETYGDRIKQCETQDGWQEWMKMPRGIYYFDMKTDPGLSAIFDDSLFETGVIGLPEE